LADFQLDFARQYIFVDISARLIARAAMLARKHGLRGYDAVQLAAALETQGPITTLTLLSSDTELNAAATLEGLTVDNPNLHP
jgi:predicted nucleic acid-binding protein